MMTEMSRRIADMQGLLQRMDGVVVAFSGGVDSTLVAAVAARALGPRALAVTGVSASLAPGELDGARRIASSVGIVHRTVRTDELMRPGYVENGADRCYHCKTELYDVLGKLAAQEGLPVVASGANVDDLGDVRPGLRAAKEHGVRHPLVESGFTKRDVRTAARELDIPTWDKPASACLSSRIAFGQRVTVGELTRVGRAERLLKELGFRQCRVRVHGELARIEVDREAVSRLADPGVRERIATEFRALGYGYVTVDLEGFRSGSMHTTADGPRDIGA
ncbi:MAG: ATP-dependent sacrificial sulfur transferase LarE [Actinomycetota bacterium]